MSNARMHRSEIPAWDCYRLLGEHRVGRLGIIEHGYPIALPVSYLLMGANGERRIVIRTSPGATIAQHSGRASLELDHINEKEKSAWSVIARGTLHRLVEDETPPDPEPWLVEGRHQWLALDIIAVSGRRFVGRPAGEGFGLEWRFE